MTVQSEIDEEEERRRAEPMGDISPESIAAGELDDEPAAEMDLPEQVPQGVDEPAAPAPPPPELPNPSAVLAKTIASPQSDAAARIEEIRSRRYAPSAAVSDEAIAKARADRKAAVGRNDFTRAIQAALLRRPFNPTDPEDEAGDLLRLRQQEQHGFERRQDREFSLQQALAKALKGEKATTPGGLSAYQQAQLNRAAEAEAYRRERDKSTDAWRAEQAKRQQENTEINRDLAESQREFNRIQANRSYAETRRAHDEAKGERERKQTEDVPPGYEIDPAANPSADSRKKFTGLVASQRKMKELTAAMRSELQGVSLADRMLPGDKRRRLQQLATQMRIEAKNVADLGALSGPDMGLMEAMATDPTSLASLGGGSLEANLAGLDSWADSSVTAGEKAYGIRKAGGGGGGQSGGKIRVRNKETGQTGRISPQFFDPAKYERIDG